MSDRPTDTTNVARMVAAGRNPGSADEPKTSDSAVLHPGYGAEFEWQEVKISDLAGAYAGGTPSRTISRYFGGPIPWVKSSELNRPVIDGTEETLSEEGFSSSSAKWIPARTPLIAMYGATAGRISWLKIKATSNQAVLALVPEQHQCDSRWLYWVLMANTEKLISSSIQGSGQPNLSKSVIERFTVHAPLDMHEQHRIAEILDTLDDAIQKTEQLIAKFKQIKQGLLHDLLTRGIDENGQLRDPIAHPEQFKDSELGRIPRGWRIVPLRQLVESLDAGVSVNAFDYPAASGQIGVLKTSAVNGGKFYPRENKAVLPQEISRVRVRPEADSIIVSRMNTPELVGEHGYVDEFFCDLYLPDRLWLVTFKDKDLISARWLSFFLSTPSAKRHITLHATGTSGSMKNLPKDKFLAMLIPLPGLAEQNLVAEMLESHEDRITLEGCHHQKLQAIKKGLVRDLLTGRVRTIQGE